MRTRGADGHIADSPRVKLPGVRGHLLGVGPVPEDGVAVRHHFGAGLLAENTHQQHQAHEDDHFHMQHHYSETSARIPLRCWVGQSVDSCRALQPGQVTGLVHMWPCVVLWRSFGLSSRTDNKQRAARWG